MVVIADSGSTIDIQNAVDVAIASGDNEVQIPSGTFDFEPRDTATTTGVMFDVPSTGITIRGAGIDETILVCPKDNDSDNTVLFGVDGYDTGAMVRFTGLTLKGRPELDTSPTGEIGVRLQSCTDFRIDDCSFYWMGAAGVQVTDVDNTYGHEGGDISYVSQGLVDHCYFYEIYKPECTAAGNGYGYGVSVARAYHYLWTVPNLYPDDPWGADLFGTYYKNTYIEDCYFTGCRHGTQATWGGAYVLRYSTIEDVPLYECVSTGHPVRSNVLGMLAQEIYGCTITNTGLYDQDFIGPHIEGGYALIYDNVLTNLYHAFSLASCEDAGNPFYPLGNLKEVYIWNNTLEDCGDTLIGDNSGFGGCSAPIEDTHYFLHAPASEKNYVPYTYPHPLQGKTKKKLGQKSWKRKNKFF